MDDDKYCKSSKNLTVDESISKTKYSHISNNLSQNETHNKNIFFNFLTSKKKITLKSCFDHKGAKKFLSEKEKAMASFELFDDIEEKRKKRRRSRKSLAKSKSKKNFRSKSEKVLINVKAKKSKFINEDKKEIKKHKMSDKTIPLDFAENYKRHQKRKLTINSDFSNIKEKESLKFASKHNDSIIYSILKEMAEVKH